MILLLNINKNIILYYKKFCRISSNNIFTALRISDELKSNQACLEKFF